MGKQILITGEHSYIGTALREYVEKKDIGWQIDAVSVRDDNWKNIDFKKYQTIIHLAAVVHQKEQPEMKDLYKKVNTRLPIQIARRAKQSGVNQFIFLSTMAVYGEKVSIISEDTKVRPKTLYGRAKLAAEKKLKKLSDSRFQVVVLRPPMVYGRNCPGNYGRLASLALKLPLFPKIQNERSMIYIENLCECICECIEAPDAQYKIVCPQNIDYVNTTELVREIRKAHGKKTWIVPVGGRVISFLAERIPVFHKVFGDLVYVLSEEDSEYQMVDFEESVRRTEGGGTGWENI